MPRFTRLSALPVVLLDASLAPACPLCDSATGAQVRAGIFNADFGPNLFMTFLPFLILLSVVALVPFALAGPRPKEK